MTAPEFEAMGGVFATPAGYDPEAAYFHERQGSRVLGKKTPRRDEYAAPDVKGVIAGKTVNPTDPNPGFTTVPFSVIVELAKAHGVKPLSINWPDKYSPDFTGVPSDS
jgi:hypothetical protein